MLRKHDKNKEKKVEDFIEGATQKKAGRKKRQYPWTGLNPREKFMRRPSREDDGPSNWGRSIQVNLNGYNYEKIKFVASLDGRSITSFMIKAALKEASKELEKHAGEKVKQDKLENVIGIEVD